MNIIKAEQIKIGTQLAATFPASSSTGPSSQTAHRAASIRLSASLPACMV